MIPIFKVHVGYYILYIVCKPFAAESVVFQAATQKLKDQDI